MDELAKKYADIIKSKGKSELILEEVASKIKTITYTDTKLPITEEDQEILLERICYFYNNRTTQNGKKLVEADDNRNIIRFVNRIRDKLRG